MLDEELAFLLAACAVFAAWALTMALIASAATAGTVATTTNVDICIAIWCK